MGILFERIRFAIPAPTIETLCRQIEFISGLPVIYREMDDDCKGNLYEILGYLTFAEFPDTLIKISSYRIGAFDEFTRSHFAGMESRMVVPINQYEQPGEQSIHLQGYVGQELTLFMTTMIAMQDLGGILESSLSEEEITHYRKKITPEIVRMRLHENQSMSWGLACLTVLVLPLLMVLSIVRFLFLIMFIFLRYRKTARREIESSCD